MSPIHWDVCLVTDRSFSCGRSTLAVVKAAVAGGVSVVQLREKDLETGAFYNEGLKIRGFLRDKNIPLIINDRVDLALALNADGVHLGQSDLPVSVARKILGLEKIIGLSVTRPAHINTAEALHADYLGISPIFLTSTKPDADLAWGLSGLKEARLLTGLPLVAIGSVNLQNAREVIESGADCIAVVTAIVSADDPEAATRSLIKTVREAKSRAAR